MDTERIESELRDVVPFLSMSYGAEVRKQALALVESFSGDAAVADLLCAKLDAVPFVVRMIGDPAFSSAALNALSNLSACDGFNRAALPVAAVDRLVDVVRQDDTNSAELALAVLSNMTRDEKACRVLIQQDSPKLQGTYLKRLVSLWHGFPALVGNIVTNVAQTDTGRDVLMREDVHALRHIVDALSLEDVEARLATLRLVRNLCLDRRYHPRLVAEGSGLVSTILVSLLGPEPKSDADLDGALQTVKEASHPGKVREANRDVVSGMVQVLSLLVRVYTSRVYLKSIKLYPILRDLHIAVGDDDDLCQAIEDVVYYLVNDEERDVQHSPSAT
ncbi:Protein HGH1 like protein [Plasmodiophora brassicae]|uniref:Protein HGH1 homolog n=1 Tax=Plasmodiophora brassicae TaxID=37360 RepID=A0A0G4IX75_PLABS|nr:hypothetical protein PBRA_007369 [Plasmodiophora brassicae]SPQ98029.1 unnamed protein product [Plasmodiophora brassicae]